MAAGRGSAGGAPTFHDMFAAPSMPPPPPAPAPANPGARHLGGTTAVAVPDATPPLTDGQEFLRFACIKFLAGALASPLEVATILLQVQYHPVARTDHSGPHDADHDAWTMPATSRASLAAAAVDAAASSSSSSSEESETSDAEDDRADRRAASGEPGPAGAQRAVPPSPLSPQRRRLRALQRSHGPRPPTAAALGRFVTDAEGYVVGPQATRLAAPGARFAAAAAAAGESPTVLEEPDTHPARDAGQLPVLRGSSVSAAKRIASYRFPAFAPAGDGSGAARATTVGGWRLLWRGQFTNWLADMCSLVLQPAVEAGLVETAHRVAAAKPSGAALHGLPLALADDEVSFWMTLASHAVCEFVLSPLETARTRLIVQSVYGGTAPLAPGASPTALQRKRRYRGLMHTLRRMVAEEGLANLYFGPACAATVLHVTLTPLFRLGTSLVLAHARRAALGDAAGELVLLDGPAGGTAGAETGSFAIVLLEVGLHLIEQLVLVPLETVRRRLQTQITPRRGLVLAARRRSPSPQRPRRRPLATDGVAATASRGAARPRSPSSSVPFDRTRRRTTSLSGNTMMTTTTTTTTSMRARAPSGEGLGTSLRSATAHATTTSMTAGSALSASVLSVGSVETADDSVAESVAESVITEYGHETAVALAASASDTESEHEAVAGAAERVSRASGRTGLSASASTPSVSGAAAVASAAPTRPARAAPPTGRRGTRSRSRSPARPGLAGASSASGLVFYTVVARSGIPYTGLWDCMCRMVREEGGMASRTPSLSQTPWWAWGWWPVRWAADRAGLAALAPLYKGAKIRIGANLALLGLREFTAYTMGLALSDDDIGESAH
ncbi:hypothetical protein CXG81DRAFT_27741 [Caulochytrium protostelioides]|uniref:Mitochondrial carrier n=1 Tax=Caulochytrium protostelioides TaxID=1555241 RepID=A0A4P9X3B0_9FUNG|nr:hypothetical protein CXG81DRAFT_27741 [Caulochytrium protostelioides]|eukprot:RKO99502.1 hypothetical protein CXG81DRAFT_27741 [Caulochytrium protostelioides]